jgi:hypothetical protein
MLTWVTLGRDKYRTTYRDEVWWLVATPEAAKPWLLYTEREHGGRPVRDKVQEIGAGTPEAARHAAELWLGLDKLCRG